MSLLCRSCLLSTIPRYCCNLASWTSGPGFGLMTALACERHHARDVSCVLSPDDESWAAVNPSVEDGAGRVVGGVFWRDHPPVETSAKLRVRDGDRVGIWRS